MSGSTNNNIETFYDKISLLLILFNFYLFEAYKILSGNFYQKSWEKL